MRTIKFRGIDIETGQWINGDLIQYKGYLPNIHFSYMSNDKLRYGQCVVKKETVGQFTGLLDKNDKEIYEGDILGKEGSHNCVVEWNNILAHFQGTWANMPITACDIHTIVQYDYKVLGNIYDNPDLLNNTKEK